MCAYLLAVIVTFRSQGELAVCLFKGKAAPGLVPTLKSLSSHEAHPSVVGELFCGGPNLGAAKPAMKLTA